MISAVNVAANRVVVQGEKDLSLLGRLKTGQVLQARVLKSLPDGDIQLLVNGRVITARTPLLLNPDTLVQLTVADSEKGLVLKLASFPDQPPTTSVPSFMRVLTDAVPFQDLFKLDIPRIRGLLNKLALKSGTPDHGILSTIVRQGGLRWEASLADLFTRSGGHVSKQDLEALLQQDLKGLLIRHAGLSGEGSASQAKVITDILHTIDNYQSFNQYASESGKFLLPFPVFGQESFSFGRLLIDLGDRDGAREGGPPKTLNVSLFLDMSALGPVRVDFSMYGKSLSGSFKLKDRETCQYITALIPGLKKRLMAKKFQVHDFFCQVAKIEEIGTVPLVETILNRGDDQVLNVVV